MKTTITALALLLSLSSIAQKIEKYFDYAWRPTDATTARYYALIEKKNSLWLRKDYFIHEGRLQMEGHYKDSACKKEEGKFSYYHANGALESTGAYTDGKRQGLWLRFHENGMTKDSVTYVNDNVIGTRLCWHSNGFLSDSSVMIEDGSGVSVSWFDNGNPSAAGKYAAGNKMHGKWQFFHKNGKTSAVEVYDNGRLLSKQYIDEEGNTLSDTTNRDREASFPGGLKAWQKYLVKNLYFPSQWKLANADMAIVVVDAAIDEEGNVTDIRLTAPLHPDFDQIALNVLRKAPKWNAAVSHNRKVKFYFRQPVVFQQ
ncbi:energy transducer TonB [Chitinophagaceae bacterium LB-8]|uniref:Energy transducer TonB n=1 Tax=Paraflavisolibacter caeni TaxID=2982496 RepID=A0A9X2XMS4_9BACT|nr:energy transducer TonB [Paraflavisolibacter caeni]MCU7547783.1 energy transducer TonB [Paraflavisolibacter caeni]